MERRQHEVEQERVRRHRRHPDAATQTLEAGRSYVQQVNDKGQIKSKQTLVRIERFTSVMMLRHLFERL